MSPTIATDPVLLFRSTPYVSLLLSGWIAVPIVLAFGTAAWSCQPESFESTPPTPPGWAGVGVLSAEELAFTESDTRLRVDPRILLQLREEGFEIARIQGGTENGGDFPEPNDALLARLRELSEWRKIQQVGLLERLSHGDWANRFELSAEAIAAVGEAEKEARSELQQSCRRLEAFILERLLHELHREQRQQIAVELGTSEEWSKLAALSPRVLRLQLEHSSQVRELNRKSRVEPDYQGDRHLMGFGSQVRLALTPEQLVLRPDVQRCLELSTDQVSALEQIRGKAEMDLLQLHSEMLLARRRGADAAFLGLEELEAEALMRETREEMLSQVLLPEQRNRLSRLADWNRARTLGWLPILVDGSLGHRLKVTAAQRVRLFRAAQELCDEVDEAHLDMLVTYHLCLLDALGEEQSRRVQDALGEMPGLVLLSDPAAILGHSSRTLRNPSP